ncbi:MULTISPECIES: hypothetical protein [unclassified Synechococcus]|uniref:hypothetical protein n=1 Tax=unclassified Synechococcus TaxID=2626047 RepID=UPI0020CDAF87|nr:MULTISPECIES: hypothetical protein [unclassified Synechococcus]
MAKPRPFRSPIVRLAVLALVVLLVGWQLGGLPALAQKITGTLGAPNASTTLSGNQLPAPAPPPSAG